MLRGFSLDAEWAHHQQLEYIDTPSVHTEKNPIKKAPSWLDPDCNISGNISLEKMKKIEKKVLGGTLFNARPR